jgi:transketolase
VTVIIDHNNLQGYGRPTEICSFEPVCQKWEAFGWHTIDIDGHNISQISAAFEEDSEGKPKMIIARTTKGKGVSFMEDQLVWHYYIVTDEHLQQAQGELS